MCGFGQDYATGAMVNVLPWATQLIKPNNTGNYFLDTTSKKPFCGKSNSKLKIYSLHDIFHSYKALNGITKPHS